MPAASMRSTAARSSLTDSCLTRGKSFSTTCASVPRTSSQWITVMVANEFEAADEWKKGDTVIRVPRAEAAGMLHKLYIWPWLVQSYDSLRNDDDAGSVTILHISPATRGSGLAPATLMLT